MALAPAYYAENRQGSTARACLGTLIFLLLLMFSTFACIAVSQTVVETLPGFPGTLPFKLETGYIGVGDADEVQLFYYFIESERNPVTDPLLLWISSGPGCSGLAALAFEIGPLTFDVGAFNGSIPTLGQNPHSWTKVASIIFIDQPCGAGFSYATTSDAYNTSDTRSAAKVYSFLRKWFTFHPQFLFNPLYIGGDSYSGMTLPVIVQTILNGIEDDLYPMMDLQGYLLGNPATDYFVDGNSRIPYAHRVNLLSDEQHLGAELYCHGDYLNVDANNTLCLTVLQSIKECLQLLNYGQILEPLCGFLSPKIKQTEWDPRAQEEDDINFILSLPKLPELRCRSFGYALAYKWANNKSVQDALNVRPGTVANWTMCPKRFDSYTKDVNSTIAYHKNFTETGLRALIYSGDQDLIVPYMGTMEWINALGLSIFDQWRPWFFEGQVAGYTQKYMNDHFSLTYATVKGAGHTAPEYKPEESLALVDRFFARYPI
ncbi:serine carboxypeptidase-like 13 isoform X2 [Malania oleifera]|uniref:serine carboxypeptidase-like 13 isoform X2 n=1 Tax=Malania oleifera TaxID=397392 RepID=UPI0025AE11FA|nr:serine carboxypeptidase-like 13 isoform X2 [Malania oleifera]